MAFLKLEVFKKIVTSNIPELENLNEIEMYPNPTNEFVEIASEDPFKFVQLFDVSGRELCFMEYEALTTVTIIDLTGYEHGIYFMKAANNKGTVIKKIIYGGQ